ncbi:hypothetical protein D3C84_354700 [compost metagenome]
MVVATCHLPICVPSCFTLLSVRGLLWLEGCAGAGRRQPCQGLRDEPTSLHGRVGGSSGVAWSIAGGWADALRDRYGQHRAGKRGSRRPSPRARYPRQQCGRYRLVTRHADHRWCTGVARQPGVRSGRKHQRRRWRQRQRHGVGAWREFVRYPGNRPWLVRRLCQLR